MIETEEVRDESEAPSVTPEYAIEIQELTKKYGKTLAANKLSMRVPKGSVYGFVGPNGAGKTTTIRTLATLQKPDSGTVELCGLNVVKSPGEVRDRVGYMPDFFGVYDNLTVGEYLDFYGASHRLPLSKRRQLCDELLELVDLTDKRHELVHVLSRGMKQRLGLARCLIHDPDVLLLDEPASGMDPRARIELREILRELSRLNKTILISSHILPELAEMCTDIGIIRAGSLLAEGSVDDVVSMLSHGRRLRISLLDGSQVATAQKIVADYGCETFEERDEHTFMANIDPGEEEQAQLLSDLLKAGVRVSSFAVESGTLEDVFLTVSDMGREEE